MIFTIKYFKALLRPNTCLGCSEEQRTAESNVFTQNEIIIYLKIQFLEKIHWLFSQVNFECSADLSKWCWVGEGIWLIFHPVLSLLYFDILVLGFCTSTFSSKFWQILSEIFLKEYAYFSSLPDQELNPTLKFPVIFSVDHTANSSHSTMARSTLWRQKRTFY